MMDNDLGVPASPSGHSAEPEPKEVSAAVAASVPNVEYAGTDFGRGAQACREMMARFVEQGGDSTIANSIRLNWHPGWGEDPGPPPEVIDTWEPPECPEGEAAYRVWCEGVPGVSSDCSPEDLIGAATMLVRWGYPMFPANRQGQVPFVRGLMESAVRTLARAASAIETQSATTAGRGPEDESAGPKDDAQPNGGDAQNDPR